MKQALISSINHNFQLQYNIFEKAWKQITTNTIGIKYIIHKPTPWWNKNIDKLVREVRTIYRKICKLKRQKKPIPHNIAQQYKHKRNARTNAIRKAKRKYIQRINKILQIITNQIYFIESLLEGS